MRILGEDARVLRQQAEKLRAILTTSPFAINVRDDWGNDAIRMRLEIDQDRAGLAGVSSRDIAIVDVLERRRCTALAICVRGARTSRSCS